MIVDEESLAVEVTGGRHDPWRYRDMECRTQNGHEIDLSEAAAIALWGRIRRVVRDSAGAVIDLGRRRRLFSGSAREASLLLDDRCAWPGCDREVRGCQADHSVAWKAHGATVPRNGGPLCGAHNRLKDRGGSAPVGSLPASGPSVPPTEITSDSTPPQAGADPPRPPRPVRSCDDRDHGRPTRRKGALVTGSTRGIGRAIAERLAAVGATVIVHGRTAESCAAVAAEIPGSIPVAVELSSAEAGDRLVAEVIDAAGQIDIVVNNAGVALDNFITGVTDERWEETLVANLTAPFTVIRAATRAFKTQGTGGAVVNLTSTSGERGNAGQAAYAASKGGLHAVTQTAARELGRFGVRVNSVSPMAATTMNGLVDPERRAAVATALPLGAVTDPAHVAEAVAFLVGDRAAFITGELIHVDAGFHLS